MTDSRRRSLLLGSLAAPLLAAPAYAQGWQPARPVRMIVPIAPGGANDIIARMIGERLSAVIGQTVIIENRPGAGGNIGAQAVLQAEKDGLTWLFTSANVLTANTYLYGSRMPFVPLRDFTPVTRVGVGTLLWVVNAQRPWRTFQEQIDFAKANPGRVTMGSSGTGAISHLYFEKVKRETGTDMTHVPYRGGGPAIQDLMSGNIDMMFDVIPALLPHVREGRFRALAAGSARRIDYVPELANVPAMDDLLPGKGIDALNWWSVVAATGTPEPAVAGMHAALQRVLAQEEVKQRLLGLTVFPLVDENPAAFGAFWRAQVPVWRELVEASGATAE
ncbi:tripartite tricarboxylate transporter substrate binding protein [Roseococcus sp. SYP-B2431]|uniref:Bug family tripartite tricarboxylate transporter substrate binding protein n=1 Tax=Roseococcus sp. SYP-B2431 TaxID=2496640 RepID=UPI00103AFA0A|nr:tripartite tricarboxylate transporter substrate binding protein [Roseococcus sp. SYP-B2431]TCH99955.1 tripartite tricarboxylate transporter substrate binding protein [Roseococcus sp. SYP-B2431]